MTIPENFKTIKAHQEAVSSLAWHPSGHFLASGDWSGELKLWNTLFFNLIDRRHEIRSPVNDLLFSPSGNHLGVVFESGDAFIYSFYEKKLKFRQSCKQENISALQWLTDENFFLTTDKGGRLSLWNLFSSQVLFSEDFNEAILSFKWSPSRNLLALSLLDEGLLIYDFLAKEVSQSFDFHSSPVYDFVWCEASSQILSLGEKGDLLRWDIKSSKIILDSQLESPKYYSIGLNQEEGFFVVSNESGLLEFYNWNSAHLLKRQKLSSSALCKMKYSADLKSLVTADMEGNLYLNVHEFDNLINKILADFDPGSFNQLSRFDSLESLYFRYYQYTRLFRQDLKLTGETGFTLEKFKEKLEDLLQVSMPLENLVPYLEMLNYKRINSIKKMDSALENILQKETEPLSLGSKDVYKKIGRLISSERDKIVKFVSFMENLK